MMRKKIIIWSVFLFGAICYAQQNGVATKPFKLQSWNGYVSLNGQYVNSFSGFDQVQGSYNFGGGIFLNTRSYIWHPNFLTLNVSGGYEPQQGEVNSTTIPDYFTNLSSATFAVRASFLSNLKYNFNSHFTYNKRRAEDRFYDKDIELKRWGANFRYQGSYQGSYKIRSDFEQNDSKEFDHFTERAIAISRTSFKNNVTKSFFKSDRNILNVNFQKTTSAQQNSYINSNNLIYMGYNNKLFLNKKQTIPLNTNLIYSNIKGTQNSENLGFNQSLNIPIVKSLNSNVSFRKRKYIRDEETADETAVFGSLNYNLYESLNTGVSYGQADFDRSNSFDVKDKTARFYANYRKKINFIKGDININYDFEYQEQTRLSIDSILSIYDERKVMRDGEVTLLNRPYVLIETVVVKDVTGTIFYQENIDYILAERGIYVEIQRLIGGAIENNMVVFIDYDTYKNSSYDYDSPGSRFEIRFTLLDDFLEFNYTKAFRDYKMNYGDVKDIGAAPFSMYRYGARVMYKSFSGGVSYEANDSEAFPYKLWAYNFSSRGKIGRKMNYYVNGIVSDYVMYFTEGETNKIALVSADLAYNINNSTRLTFNFSYSHQEGDIQNFTMITGRAEIKKYINQLEISLRANVHNRNVPNQRKASQYVGTFLRIKRYF